MLRYIVHDEDGPLRKFWSKQEALQWLSEGMHLVVLPKPKKVDYYELCTEICGEALF